MSTPVTMFQPLQEAAAGSEGRGETSNKTTSRNFSLNVQLVGLVAMELGVTLGSYPSGGNAGWLLSGYRLK